MSGGGKGWRGNEGWEMGREKGGTNRACNLGTISSRLDKRSTRMLVMSSDDM